MIRYPKWVGLLVSPSSLVSNAYDAYPPPHVACPIHLRLRLACRAMSSPVKHPTVTVNGDRDGDDWAFSSSSDGGTRSAPWYKVCQGPLLLSNSRVSLLPPLFPPLVSLFHGRCALSSPISHHQRCPPSCPSTAALAIALRPADHNGRVLRRLMVKTIDLKSGKNQTTTTVRMATSRRHCSVVAEHWGFPNLEGAASSGRAKTRERD